MMIKSMTVDGLSVVLEVREEDYVAEDRTQLVGGEIESCGELFLGGRRVARWEEGSPNLRTFFSTPVDRLIFIEFARQFLIGKEMFEGTMYGPDDIKFMDDETVITVGILHLCLRQSIQ